MSVQSNSTIGTIESKSLADVEARFREESEMVRHAQEAIMQRPNFAIDAIGDSDGEDEGGEDDTSVMDEVSATAHESNGPRKARLTPITGRGIPQGPRR